ncbi:hypothetical protein OAT84_03270 [Gammaproteobacteria bacterium]|nr:hypothetical protein [Gammaproteobacteria bacterium]
MDIKREYYLNLLGLETYEKKVSPVSLMAKDLVVLCQSLGVKYQFGGQLVLEGGQVIINRDLDLTIGEKQQVLAQLLSRR